MRAELFSKDLQEFLRVHEKFESGGRTVPVWILGLDALRMSKQDAGRPKDLDDLAHLPRA